MSTTNFLILMIAPVSAILITAAAFWLTARDGNHKHGPAE